MDAEASSRDDDDDDDDDDAGVAPASPGPSGALARVAARAFWLGVAPALLSAGFVRLTTSGGGSGTGESWAAIAICLFVLFSLLLRYWRAHLPGGRHLAPRIRPRQRSVPQLPLVLGVAAAAAAALLLRSSIARPYRVVSTSMLPALEPGDVLWVNKRAYGLRLPFVGSDGSGPAPRRGDVVVFRAVERDGEEGSADVVVKRVIGLPGDHVAMEGGHPILNGQPIPSCDAGLFVHFTAGKVTQGRLRVEQLDGRQYLVVREAMPVPFPGYYVQPDEVFVLGDNRGSSNDSRIWRARYGAGVPLASIDGRVDRLLYGLRRDGHLDRQRLWKQLGLDVRLPGVDTTALEAGIRRCSAALTAAAKR